MDSLFFGAAVSYARRLAFCTGDRVFCEAGNKFSWFAHRFASFFSSHHAQKSRMWHPGDKFRRSRRIQNSVHASCADVAVRVFSASTTSTREVLIFSRPMIFLLSNRPACRQYGIAHSAQTSQIA